MVASIPRESVGRPDTGIGVEFSVRMVRVAIVFHSVITLGSAGTGGSALASALLMAGPVNEEKASGLPVLTVCRVVGTSRPFVPRRC